MDRATAIALMGVVLVGTLVYGAYAFGKILTERDIPSVDERLEYLKRYQSLRTEYERVEAIRAYGAARRPALTLNFVASAGECESFRESAEFALGEAWTVAQKYPDGRPTGNERDASLVDFYTTLALAMIDGYDNCLGNP